MDESHVKLNAFFRELRREGFSAGKREISAGLSGVYEVYYSGGDLRAAEEWGMLNLSHTFKEYCVGYAKLERIAAKHGYHLEWTGSFGSCIELTRRVFD
jgi:hypothetical protein